MISKHFEMFYQSSVSLTHHWLHYINWILTVTNPVFPVKDTWNLNFNASKCSVYCSVSGQRLQSLMFHSPANRQKFQSTKFIVITFKVHSSANRQKSQSSESKVHSTASVQMIQSSTFYTNSSIKCLIVYHLY